jgi:mannose-6-phosphate isomerase-like protein (cupin superfamily)
VRRVVVASDENGQSFVAADEEIAGSGRLWDLDPAQAKQWLGAVDPGQVYRPAQPPAGGATWWLSQLPPGKGTVPLADPPPGMDAREFHVTKTTDFVFVLSGSATLDLDRGHVVVGPGDAVVLQAASHAWRNPGDVPVRFLDVMISGELPACRLRLAGDGRPLTMRRIGIGFMIMNTRSCELNETERNINRSERKPA